MKVTKQEKKVKEFEKKKKYNNDTIDLSKCHYDELDKNYDYLKNDFFYTIMGFITRSLIKIYIPFHNFICYQLKIKGKENLKKVQKTGVIAISNHSQYLDIAISRMVFYNRRYYATSAIFNNKKGFGGNMLKAIGALPLSLKFSAQKSLGIAITKLLSKNRVISFHPEKAMWKNYRNPRPFMRGAFYYAAQNNVPILPMIVLYRKTNKLDKFFGRKNKLTVKILEPIYPLPQITTLNEQTNYLRDKAQYVYNYEFEKFYGKKNNVITVKNPDENINFYIRKAL